MTQNDSFESKGALAFFWSAINTGGMQFIGLIFSIILARLLAPEDFGNMAILVFVVLVSNIFVDSGLSHALIRDQKVTKLDYDSVFFFSILIAGICTLLIYHSAQYLSVFFKSPVLKDLIQLGSISPLIYALMTINTTIITKNLDFKLKAKLSITSVLVSGLFAVAMAYSGYGVWSLLAMHLLNPTLLMLLMYISIDWKPNFHFSIHSIAHHIRFGLKLSLSNLANILYTKSYVLVVGKSFSAEYAGYFARADHLKDLPTTVLGKIITRAAYPVLSMIQDDPEYLRNYNIKIIKFTALISIPVMLGLAAIVEPLIIFLIGEKWLPSADILFYLCFAGILFPFDLLNMNILKVHGKMNLYLTLELLKIFLVLPVLVMGVYYGMKAMLVSIIIHTIISFLISARYSGRIINYSFQEYLSDLKIPLLLSMLMFYIVITIKGQIEFNSFITLIILIIIGFSTMILLYELAANIEYKELKKNIISGSNE